MNILISAKKPSDTFEVGDLIYINRDTGAKRLIIANTNTHDCYAAFNPETCIVTTAWYDTIDTLLNGMSPVLIKKGNKIALTEVIK